MLNKDKESSKGAMIDDIAGMVGGVAGLVSEMRQQVKNDVRSRVQDAADRANLARLEDVERLESLLHDIEARVSALEAAQKPAKAKKTSTAKKAKK